MALLLFDLVYAPLLLSVKQMKVTDVFDEQCLMLLSCSYGEHVNINTLQQQSSTDILYGITKKALCPRTLS
jgi:hypothetical protein